MLDFLDPARLFRIGFLIFLSLLAIFIEAAPLGLSPTAPPSPDLLMCVVIYWAIRRPGSTPLIVIFALGLLRDFLTDEPIGAGTLALVIVAELFKTQRRQLQRSNFVVEWLATAVAVLGATTMVWVLVVITFAQPAYLIDLLHQCLYTIMVYPLVVIVFRWVLRISWRKVEVA